MPIRRNSRIPGAMPPREHKPVWESDQRAEDPDPSEPPALPIVREVWIVGGRQHVVEYVSDDVPRAPQIEPVIKKGIDYARPDWLPIIQTWED